ncbi:hypothetical protein ACN42_g1072 [Penicillium freii]|uniref:Uncharacterized protein n=1 Tax=Penicillium freii TaxID=48697 RepID=A0A117NRQ6_PENFR|nr:hypothetical protein ACN42_g1072 [Penicillium freii]
MFTRPADVARDSDRSPGLVVCAPAALLRFKDHLYTLQIDKHIIVHPNCNVSNILSSSLHFQIIQIPSREEQRLHKGRPAILAFLFG